MAREVLTENLEQTKQNVMGTALSTEAKQASIQKSCAMWFLFTTIPPLKSTSIDAKTLFLGNV